MFGIQAGMRIADFGAGSGAYVMSLAAALDGTGIVYAIDIQKDLLRRIANDAKRAGYTNVEVLWGDLEQEGSTKLADASVDLVLISNLLFQVEHKNSPLREAHRILKPSGRLVIIDWSDSYGGMGPEQKQVVSKADALALAQNEGFTLVKEFEAGEHHYGLIFKRISETSA